VAQQLPLVGLLLVAAPGSPAVAAGAPAGASSGPPPAAMPMGISSLPVSK